MWYSSSFDFERTTEMGGGWKRETAGQLGLRVVEEYSNTTCIVCLLFAPYWPLYMETKNCPPLEKILGAPLDSLIKGGMTLQIDEIKCQEK